MRSVPESYSLSHSGFFSPSLLLHSIGGNHQPRTIMSFAAMDQERLVSEADGSHDGLEVGLRDTRHNYLPRRDRLGHNQCGSQFRSFFPIFFQPLEANDREKLLLDVRELR